ncbi:hypothetical protein [Luteimonas suaedae]|uniref:hypothetical protein n=1 Tax=Luteimonas suaedae TaxID=2605430 RepID=UPI0011EEB167|nr:hypothetical protein [Luteimonas suaedae]
MFLSSHGHAPIMPGRLNGAANGATGGSRCAGSAHARSLSPDCFPSDLRARTGPLFFLQEAEKPQRGAAEALATRDRCDLVIEL